jgi:hypothetical protein
LPCKLEHFLKALHRIVTVIHESICVTNLCVDKHLFLVPLKVFTKYLDSLVDFQSLKEVFSIHE